MESRKKALEKGIDEDSPKAPQIDEQILQPILPIIYRILTRTIVLQVSVQARRGGGGEPPGEDQAQGRGGGAEGGERCQAGR